MKGLTISNFALNLIIIAGVIYLLLRFRNRNRTASEGTPDVSAPAWPPIELRPLNSTSILRVGDTNSDVLALQMMLRYYYPDQPLTGTLDTITDERMRTVTAGVSMGAITLHDFSGRFFRPAYGEDAWKSIVQSFPNL